MLVQVHCSTLLCLSCLPLPPLPLPSPLPPSPLPPLPSPAAYEPPQEIMFVQPHHSDTLTLERRATFSLEHDLKLSVSKSYWRENKLKQPQLDVCLTAAMHFNRSFPPGFVIVSPICFVSLKSQHHPSITFTVPHALRSSEKERNRICILFMHTVDPNLSIDSPIGLPTERTLSCLRDDVIKEIGPNFVSFGTQLVCPTLFAVGMRTDEKIPAPLALKCSLFVTYPILDGNTTISAFEVVVYIGMSLKTVETVSLLSSTCIHCVYSVIWTPLEGIKSFG